MLARAKQHDFILDEALDLGLGCTLRELLLHAADEHVLEVVFVACACLALNRTKLVVHSGR